MYTRNSESDALVLTGNAWYIVLRSITINTIHIHLLVSEVIASLCAEAGIKQYPTVTTIVVLCTTRGGRCVSYSHMIV